MGCEPALCGARAPFLKRQHLVKCAGFDNAPVFQGALHGDALFAGDKRNKRIVHVDTAEIELVGAGERVGVKQGREQRGHGREIS